MLKPTASAKLKASISTDVGGKVLRIVLTLVIGLALGGAAMSLLKAYYLIPAIIVGWRAINKFAREALFGLGFLVSANTALYLLVMKAGLAAIIGFWTWPFLVSWEVSGRIAELIKVNLGAEAEAGVER